MKMITITQDIFKRNSSPPTFNVALPKVDEVITIQNSAIIPRVVSHIDQALKYLGSKVYQGIDHCFRTLTGFSLPGTISTGFLALKYTAGFFTLSVIAYLAFRVYRNFNKKPYRRFDSTDIPSNLHRPNLFAQIDPNLGAPNDSRAFSPVVSQEAEEVLVELCDIADEVLNLGDRLCPGCKSTHINCQCQFVNAHHSELYTSLVLKSDKKKRKLQSLYREIGNATFAIGDRLSFPYHKDLETKLVYEVVDTFICADTRPTNESHIRVSNTRMYVFRLVGLSGGWYGMFSDFSLRLDGHPMRDLVVSEDLIRNTRRGALTGKHPVSLLGYIDNSMSVPINDPAVLKFGASIPMDSYYICLALTSRIFGPYPLNY